MDSWSVMEQAAELARRGAAFALATVVWRQAPSSSQLGSRAIITADGELRGWIGGACAEPAVIRAAQQVISSGEAKLLLLGTPEQFGTAAQLGSGAHGAVPDGMTMVPISCQSEGALEVYIEPVHPVPHLIVVGHSPMAQTLADLAGTLGWRTDVLDGAQFSTADADENAMVVVATQGHNDEGVLERAIAARPAYLGLVGSRKRGAAVLGYLADRGVPAEQLARVQVPAGLDLGSTTHPEIAVAILAELVQLRAAGALGNQAAQTTHTTAPQTTAPQTTVPQTTVRPAAIAIDPVCGMSVTAGPDAMPLDHDGATYYFCCARCRQVFEADPAAYAGKLVQ